MKCVTKKSSAGISRRPSGPSTTTVPVERDEAKRQLGGAVGVRDRATHRAAVPRHEVPDVRQRRAHERVHALVVGEGGLAHRRPEPQSTVRRDGIEPGAVQVDEQARPHEPHRERGHEALPARDRLRVLPALGERRECLLERLGADVVERGGLHALRRPGRELPDARPA